jgi:dihydropteroate synthase
MRWVAKTFRWDFPRPALVMGIVNVTPDSFSDGGTHAEPDAAVAHAERLVAEGADILDIGGESTRPGAEPVSESLELARVLPVIERLAGRVAVPISIDTRKATVARQALAAGASIVNDVEAVRSDPALWETVAEAGAGYVAMHMQGTPETMQRAPSYHDVVAEVEAFFCERLKRFREAGISEEQVAFDPGIGFGKTPAHNLALVGGTARFAALGRPILLGLSRKSFLSRLTGTGPGPMDRLPAALACSLEARRRGAAVFRTHDVAATVSALRAAEVLDAAMEARRADTPHG